MGRPVHRDRAHPAGLGHPGPTAGRRAGRSRHRPRRPGGHRHRAGPSLRLAHLLRRRPPGRSGGRPPQHPSRCARAAGHPRARRAGRRPGRRRHRRRRGLDRDRRRAGRAACVGLHRAVGRRPRLVGARRPRGFGATVAGRCRPGRPPISCTPRAPPGRPKAWWRHTLRSGARPRPGGTGSASSPAPRSPPPAACCSSTGPCEPGWPVGTCPTSTPVRGCRRSSNAGRRWPSSSRPWPSSSWPTRASAGPISPASPRCTIGGAPVAPATLERLAAAAARYRHPGRLRPDRIRCGDPFPRR